MKLVNQFVKPDIVLASRTTMNNLFLSQPVMFVVDNMASEAMAQWLYKYIIIIIFIIIIIIIIYTYTLNAIC